MGETIPIIDIGDFLAGRPGALMAAAHQVHDALTTTGFFVLTGHDVPQPLIARTFAEARRFHQLPLDKKLALKLNEHINGYMVMGRYAVRTSDINNNDKGDLNEAFFMKRERPPDDQVLIFDTEEEDGGRIVAGYGWLRKPAKKAGTMLLTPRDGKIAKLVVTFEPSDSAATA